MFLGRCHTHFGRYLPSGIVLSARLGVQQKDARALMPVLGLLTDKHTSVRAQVVWAVGEFGARSMVRPLIALLNVS